MANSKPPPTCGCRSEGALSFSGLRRRQVLWSSRDAPACPVIGTGAPVTLHEYVVDTDRLSDAERAAVCELVIGIQAATATAFEADIPWSSDWPTAVCEAAATLVRASGATPRADPYQRTGMLRRADEAVWRAFARFAGYAYDASVWSDERLRPLVSLSDAGTSVVVLLDGDEHERLEAAVHPTRVIPLDQARAETRRARAAGHTRPTRTRAEDLRPGGGLPRIRRRPRRE